MVVGGGGRLWCSCVTWWVVFFLIRIGVRFGGVVLVCDVGMVRAAYAVVYFTGLAMLTLRS